MKKLLCLGALVLGVTFAGVNLASAQCYEPVPVRVQRPVVYSAPVYRGPYYTYRRPAYRVVRQAWIRPSHPHYRTTVYGNCGR